MNLTDEYWFTRSKYEKLKNCRCEGLSLFFHPGGEGSTEVPLRASRIQSQRLLANRNNVGLVMIDRKVR